MVVEGGVYCFSPPGVSMGFCGLLPTWINQNSRFLMNRNSGRFLALQKSFWEPLGGMYNE